MQVHAASDMKSRESVRRWFGFGRENSVGKNGKREREGETIQEFDDGADDVASN